MIEDLRWYLYLLKGFLDSLKADDGWRDCPDCDGVGYIDTSTEPYDLDVPMMMVECQTCYGLGEYYIPTHGEMQ